MAMDYIDPVSASPKEYQLLAQSEAGRMLEMRVAPGTSDQQHSHPSELVYFLSGGKARIHLPNGESMEVEIPDGHVMEHDAWTHRVENIGTTEIHAIIFEPKA